MKKIILSLVIVMSGYCCYAQTNTFPSSGNVGIGILAPGSLLTINDNIYPTLGFSLAGSNKFTFAIAGGNGYWTPGSVAGDFIFRKPNGSMLFTTDDGNNTSLIINSSGNVGIGTTQPDQKLTVNGTIHSTEVKVTPTVPVPDYVFEKTYRLINLTELKSYLAANHHLPEIPSAVEIEKNGLNLSAMNLKLLKKVEELTLYIINEDKQLSDQQKEIDELKTELKAINQLIPKH